MTYRVRFEPVAVDELLAAYYWLEDQSPVAAYRWFDGLMGVIDTLERYPYRCPLAPGEDAHSDSLRQILYGRGRNRYRILFRVKDDVVDITNIRHGARDWPPPADEDI